MIAEVVRKELLEVSRDKGFMLILLVLPIVLLVISSSVYKLEVNNLPTAMVTLDGGPYEQSVVNAVAGSTYFNITYTTNDTSSAMSMLDTGKVRAVVIVPEGFSQDIDSQQTGHVQIVIDSSDFMVLRTLKVASSKIALDSGKNISFGLIGDIEESKSLVNQTKQKVNSVESKIDQMNRTVDDKLVVMDDIVARVDQWRNMKKINDSINDILDIKQNISSMGLSTGGTGIDSVSNLTNKVDSKLQKLNSSYLSQSVSTDQILQYGDVTYFAYIAPAVMSMGIFFVGMFMTTINIVEEKVRKTLQRLYLTPIKPIEIVVGKFIAFSALGFAEGIYILVIGIALFGVVVKGSIVLAVLVSMFLAIPSVAMGLLFSIIVRTQKQAMALLPLIVVPAILVSRTFSPVETMPAYMQTFSLLSPMTYSNIALREVIIKGHGFSFVSGDLLLLFLYGLALLLACAIAFKKRL